MPSACPYPVSPHKPVRRKIIETSLRSYLDDPILNEKLIEMSEEAFAAS
jgi:hypothetical protein